MITVGGFLANRSRRVSPPRIATSSSLTILMTCWAGFSAWLTSAPRARSLTAATKSLTTGRATSASSRARRISRAVASMSASESFPLPRRFLKVSERRSESVANTCGSSGADGQDQWSRLAAQLPGRIPSQGPGHASGGAKVSTSAWRTACAADAARSSERAPAEASCT